MAETTFHRIGEPEDKPSLFEKGKQYSRLNPSNFESLITGTWAIFFEGRNVLLLYVDSTFEEATLAEEVKPSDSYTQLVGRVQDLRKWKVERG